MGALRRFIKHRYLWFAMGFFVGGCVISYNYLQQKRSVLETSTYPDELVKIVRHSDDYHRYQKELLYASARLLMSYRCSLDNFKESGGWARSPIDPNYYLVVCGSIGNIIYLDIRSGKIYLDSEILNKGIN